MITKEIYQTSACEKAFQNNFLRNNLNYLNSFLSFRRTQARQIFDKSLRRTCKKSLPTRLPQKLLNSNIEIDCRPYVEVKPAVGLVVWTANSKILYINPLR